MAYLIGTDEAGYGPNLGPLVVSATMWHVPDALVDVDLYQTLNEAVSAKVSAATENGRLAIADSKRLYQSGGSLTVLERGVLAALASLGDPPATWQSVLDLLDPDSSPVRSQLPWFRDFDLPLPVAAAPHDVSAHARRLGDCLAREGVSLCRVCSRIVHVPQFNQLLERHGSKGVLLSLTTLELIAELMDAVSSGPIHIFCDKHGGRNKYAGLLLDLTGEGLVETLLESRAESRYRFGPASRRVEIQFSTNGERFLPSALASMTSKYARELAMLALNRYWCNRADGLKPTAGYPTDAKRWLADVTSSTPSLDIDNCLLWRDR